jgi:hypothetical protein
MFGTAVRTAEEFEVHLSPSLAGTRKADIVELSAPYLAVQASWTEQRNWSS